MWRKKKSKTLERPEMVRNRNTKLLSLKERRDRWIPGNQNWRRGSNTLKGVRLSGKYPQYPERDRQKEEEANYLA